jgi:hypothetical protein
MRAIDVFVLDSRASVAPLRIMLYAHLSEKRRPPAHLVEASVSRKVLYLVYYSEN